MASDKFFRHLFEVGAAIVSLPVGLAIGTYNAATGSGTFDQGVNSIDPFIASAAEFGEKHADTIEKGIVYGVAVALGGNAVNALKLNHKKC